MTVELSRWIRVGASLSACLVLGCAGTETTNPFRGFDASGCKRNTLETALAATSLADAQDAGVDAQPQCVSYALDADALEVKLENFLGACEMSWAGSAALHGETLILRGKNAARGCAVAACGACTYDLDFLVDAVDDSQALQLRIELGECIDGSNPADIEVVTLTLPIDARPQGKLCLQSDGTFQVSDAVAEEE